MEYFNIIVDNSTMVFYPGQTINGRVVFKSSADENIKGLLFGFEGKASVHWTETNSVRTGRTRQGHQRRSVSFDSTDIFFEYHVYLIGDGQNEEILPCGEVSYPFSIQLPTYHLFTSFVGEYGRVEYTLNAIMKRPFWKFDHKTKKLVTVYAIVDLNLDPMAALPGEWKSSKSFCCLWCASGPLSLNVKLPKKGYCPGEKILAEVDVNNGSNREIYDVSMELIQQFTYFAEGEQKRTMIPIVTVRKGGPVSVYDTDYWRVELQIPPSLPPTNLGGCRIINLDYMLKVEVHVSGFSLNLRHFCPIVMGTVPVVATHWEQNTSIYPSAPMLHALINEYSHFGVGS